VWSFENVKKPPAFLEEILLRSSDGVVFEKVLDAFRRLRISLVVEIGDEVFAVGGRKRLRIAHQENTSPRTNSSNPDQVGMFFILRRRKRSVVRGRLPKKIIEVGRDVDRFGVYGADFIEKSFGIGDRMTIGVLLERPRRLVHHVRATPPRFQTRREETANAITHGLGFFASLFVGPLLVLKAIQTGDLVMIAACIAYIISLAGVYLCSMVSHAVAEPKLKLAWERWDQAMIYLLIAGAYTPYAAAYLRTGSWPMLTWAMWILATTGFLTKILFYHRMRKAIIWMYVALGWLPMISVS